MFIVRKKVVLLHPQNDASVAQLVEHLTLNQGVQGSTPCGSTKKPLKNQRLSLFLSPRREYKLLVQYSLLHNKLCKPFRRKGFQCVLLVDADVIRFHTVHALDEW